MSKQSILHLTLPRPNQVWITKDNSIGGRHFLVKIVAYPGDDYSSPYGYGIATVQMAWPEWYKKRQKWTWGHGTDKFIDFMKYCRPATRADWILYADKGWDDLAPNQYGLILASNSDQET